MTTYLKTISLAALLCGCLLSGCSGQDKPTGSQDKPAAAPADTQPAAQPAIGQPTPSSPAGANENATTPPKNIFQPSAIDPALVRQSMQARSEYEEMNRKVTARMTKLYEDNPEIKDLQAKMRELQKKIDALLAEDEELANLKKKLQAIAPEIPAIPRKPGAPLSPNASKPQKP